MSRSHWSLPQIIWMQTWQNAWVVLGIELFFSRLNRNILWNILTPGENYITMAVSDWVIVQKLSVCGPGSLGLNFPPVFWPHINKTYIFKRGLDYIIWYKICFPFCQFLSPKKNSILLFSESRNLQNLGM